MSEDTSLKNKKAAKKKKKFEMPGAFAILFIITIVAVIATWIIPAGAYSKLSYEPAKQELKIVDPHNKVKMVPGTQEQLDKIGVKINIEQFKSGAINKPISIPDTYEK